MNSPAQKQDNTGGAQLTVAHVSKRYGTAAALHDVSFEVARGEFVAVLGPSGAGKTTLFRCMAGLMAADGGTITLGGKPFMPRLRMQRRRMAFVFQQFNLINRMSAFENVLAGRLGFLPAWRGMLRQFERSDRLFALECLERVGLLAHAMQRADKLSGGQQQRVAIARALAQRPEVIIADEPVASLDPQTGADILALLRKISASDRVTVVCSLHQSHFARAYAQRIIGMAHGRLVVDVPSAEFDDAQSERLYGDAQLPNA